MKIRVVGTVVHADRHTDGQTWRN